MSKKLVRNIVFSTLLISSLSATLAFATPVDDIIIEYDNINKQNIQSTTLGDTAGNIWGDISKQAADKRTQQYITLKNRLDKLPASPKNSEEELTRRLLDWRLSIQIEGAKWDEDRIPFDNGDGFFNVANYEAANTIIRSEEDAKNWIAKIAALPSFYDLEIANMQRGIKTKFVQPKITAQSVLAILKIAYEQSPEDSPLLTPFKNMPSYISDARKKELTAEALKIVKEKIKPSQAKMVKFFEVEYIPNAREKIGASNLPDGKKYYEFTARRSTTTNLTPDEIFNIGQAEIKRIRAEMEAQIQSTGYKGTFKEFLVEIKNDKQFYAPDLPTYLEKASEIGIRIQGQLPQYFGKLPRLSWTIRQKPPELDASSGGYNLGDPQKGVAGAVVVGKNSYKDPLFSLAAWMLHEGVPGHHLQIALGQERTDIPEFRRRDDITAFVEGWALYSEKLGEEMGIYRTPYEKFGRLSFDIWRACRLVMDVGIHYKNYTYEQAAQCLYENTALPDNVIKGETERYISWPAQALAYKIGQLQIIEERKTAEQKLGDKFDIRAFHDALIGDGPMPLSILHDQITKWIDNQGLKK